MGCRAMAKDFMTKNPQNSTPQTLNPAPMATPNARKRKRRISLADVEQIAFLVEAHRMQYREACGILNIHYPSWLNWASRAKNEPKLRDIAAHVKGSWIAGRLATIGDAETGKNGHRPDWRSSAWLLERTCKERFGSQPPESAPQQQQKPTANYQIWIQAAYMNAAPEPKPATVLAAPPAERLALPEPGGTAEPPATAAPGRDFWERAGASLEAEPPTPKRRAPPMLPE